MHCIFYFLNPHKIKELDTMFFRELHDLAVIVPIVAKSDVMTMKERKAYLQAVHFHIRSLQQDLGGRWDVIFNFHEEDIPQPDNSDAEEMRDEGRQPPDARVRIHCRPAASTADSSSSSSQSPLSFPLRVPFIRAAAAGDSSLEGIDLVGEPSEADSEDYAVSSSPLGRRSPCGREEIDYSHAEIEIAVDAEDLLRVSSDDHGGCVESPCSSPSPSISMESGLVSAEGLPKVPNIFAIICSGGGGAETMQRVYPWGTVSVRDEGCSDFRRLLRQLFEAEKIAVMREATQQRSIAFNRQLRASPGPMQSPSLSNWPGSESACRWVAECKKWLFSADVFPTLVLALNLTMLVLALTEVFYWTSSSASSC